MKTDFFTSLKNKIEIATKNSFQENIKKYGADICAFSLISDDGAMTVVPFTNTLAHLKKMQIENPDDKRIMSLNRMNGLHLMGQMQSLMPFVKSL